VGGPSWAGSDRYDIVAEGASSASRQQVWLMLRSLLSGRFKVGVRYEVREPVYSLEVAKNGPKVRKPADAACQDRAAPSPSDGPVPLRCGTVHRVWGPQGGFIVGEKVSIAAS
jgi:uncharacterized protein (TIGR03435 family)